MLRRGALLLTIALFTAPVAAGALPAEIDQPPTRELRDQLAQIYAPARGNAFAAHAVYVDVARARGWSEDEISSRWPFISAVIERESHYCPNVRGGDETDANCNVTRNGRRSGHYNDAGYGQANHVHHGRGRNPNAWLCVQEGLCSAENIIATPQASMTALLAIFERSGRAPWCYDGRSRRTVVCQMG